MTIRSTEDMLKAGYVISGKRKESGTVTLELEREGVLVSSRDIGASERSVRASMLYQWLARGNSFRCRREGSETVFSATGRLRIEPPADVVAKAKRTRSPVTWERDDGFSYRTSVGRVVQTGRHEIVTSVAGTPSGYVGGLTDPLYKERTFEGRGPTLRDAMEKALEYFGA